MKAITKTFFKKHFPVRAKNSYKNLNGKVFIFAGSFTMPGAAVLCARAAYRAGAGFVTLAVPQALYKAVVCAVPQALILPLPAGQSAKLKTIKAYLKKTPQDILLLGPGLGADAALTLKILEFSKLPAVIDADSLNFLAKAGLNKLNKNIPYILTPHAGEMKRLLRAYKLNEDTAAARLAAQTGAITLLKGAHTKVSFNGASYQNTTGNEGLAKAGTGDILSGIIAALFAQLLQRETGQNPKEKAFTAALLGVYLHGSAADYAVRTISKTSLMAEDILEALPFTLKEIL